MAQISGERLQDHWSSGFCEFLDRMARASHVDPDPPYPLEILFAIQIILSTTFTSIYLQKDNLFKLFGNY